MKERSREIFPGEGLGRIQFGMSRDVVKKLAGDPDEIEQYQHDENEYLKAEAWHYDDPEVSFAFEKFNDWKLTSIAISSEEFHLKDYYLMGLSTKEAISVLEKLNLGELMQEEYSASETPDLLLVTIEDAGLNFWFEADTLTEIQFSQVWKDED